VIREPALVRAGVSKYPLNDMMTTHARTRLLLPGLVAALAGCGADDGTRWDAFIDAGADTAGDGADAWWPDVPGDTDHEVPVDDCAERARWIYLVDSDRHLIQFRPDLLTFTIIGLLDCHAGGFDPGPFSMSVDRDATAWVLYAPSLGGPGDLFRVSTEDASCAATGFVPNQHGFGVFGMGFVSNAEGSSEETLFIAGGQALDIGTGDAQFGWLDMTGLTVSPLGTVPGWPELTGTGSAELWGFFPHSTPPRVHRIDKATGEVLFTYDLDVPTGLTEAWAFAFWGGDFYIFHKLMADASSNVYKLETDDGATTLVVPESGYRIVGAGVSTCAPVLI
jgi:hypothetical protein